MATTSPQQGGAPPLPPSVSSNGSRNSRAQLVDSGATKSAWEAPAPQRRERSNSITGRVSAMAGACATRLRSLTPTRRKDKTGDQPQGESPPTSTASGISGGSSSSAASRGRSNSMGRRVAGLLCRSSKADEGSLATESTNVVVVRPRQEVAEAADEKGESNDVSVRKVTAAESLPGELRDSEPSAPESSCPSAYPAASAQGGANTTTIVSPMRQSPAPAVEPPGGLEISVDFGPRSRAPPTALHERLSRGRSGRPVPAEAVTESAEPQERQQASAGAVQAVQQPGQQPAQGGVAMSFDVGNPNTIKRMPPHLRDRLSRGAGGKKAEASKETDDAAADGDAFQKKVADGEDKWRRRPPPAPTRKSGNITQFLASSEPAIFLADHDIMRFDSGRLVRSHLTTDAIKALTENLRSLDAASVRKLLSWRLAVLHEQSTGTVPTEAEVSAMYEAEVAKAKPSMPASSSSSADAVKKSVEPIKKGVEAIIEPSQSSPKSQATIDQQIGGLEAAMRATAEAKAQDEDKQILDDLARELEELNQALKVPGISSKDSYTIRKQLGVKRAEKARAERAIRKGRKAALEIKGGDEAVQAILQSVSDNAPTLAPVRSTAAVAAEQDGWQDLETNELNKLNASNSQAALPPGFADCPTDPAALALAVILHPDTLMAAGVIAIGRVGLLSKSFKEIAFDGTDAQFGDVAWRCACRCLAREYALYCPEPTSGQAPAGQAKSGYWKKTMFEQLWPARRKWHGNQDVGSAQRLMGEMGLANEEACAHDFKMQVSIRFKPGETAKGKLLVPLHQKLALLRKNGGEDAMQQICKKEPPEFLDALMGHVMMDPVRLPSSGKICDRRVVLEQLAGAPRDPFDGSPLQERQLEPQEELCDRILTWRSEKRKVATDGGEDHKLDEDQVRELIGELGGDMDPELVEMLMEADRLRAAGNRALNAANKKLPREGDQTEENIQEDEAGGRSTAAEELIRATAGQDLAAMPVAGERRLDNRGVEAEEEELGEAPRRDGPKLLAVLPPTRVAMFQPGAGIRPFVFGRVFDAEATQDFVYDHAAGNSVCAALNGFNACLLVYGQTGSGKTHTMFGQSVACGGNAGAVVSRGTGCVVRALREILEAAQVLEDQCDVTTRLTAQYVQVYQDKVTCLCTGNPVSLREAVAGAPVVLQGADEKELCSLGDASGLLMQGEERKRYAETAMNHRSSRAHTILVVRVLQRKGDLTCTSQLHLVDLAGSERVKKSKAQGGRLVEAVGINASLSVLGRCISARVEDRSHVPYYESKLTLLLRSALGGNSRTTAIICCHKEDTHGDETLQALSFGERCAMVSNKASAAMAKSSSAAIAAIDEALSECQKRMDGLLARGKGHLPAFAKLQNQHQTLSRKRAELARTSEPPSAVVDGTV